MEIGYVIKNINKSNRLIAESYNLNPGCNSMPNHLLIAVKHIPGHFFAICPCWPAIAITSPDASGPVQQTALGGLFNLVEQISNCIVLIFDLLQ